MAHQDLKENAPRTVLMSAEATSLEYNMAAAAFFEECRHKSPKNSEKQSKLLQQRNLTSYRRDAADSL